MCKCVNVEMGSYARQTSILNPFRDKWVSVDTCLVQEIAELWHKGIETIECCCGHNKVAGYIAILYSEKAHEIMEELGYESYNHPDGLNGFYIPLIDKKP